MEIITLKLESLRKTVYFNGITVSCRQTTLNTEKLTLEKLLSMYTLSKVSQEVLPGLKNSTQGVTIPIGQQWIMGDISASVGHGQLHASYDKLTA